MRKTNPECPGFTRKVGIDCLSRGRTEKVSRSKLVQLNAISNSKTWLERQDLSLQSSAEGSLQYTKSTLDT